VFTSLNYTTSQLPARVHIFQLHQISSCCTCSHLSNAPRLFLVYLFTSLKTPRLFLLCVFTSLNNTTSLPSVLVHISQLHHVSSCFMCKHLSTKASLFLLYLFTSLNWTTPLSPVRVHISRNTMSLAAVRILISQQHHVSYCCTYTHLSTTPCLLLLYVYSSLNKTMSLAAVLIHISQQHHVSCCCTYKHLSTTPCLLLLYL